MRLGELLGEVRSVDAVAWQLTDTDLTAAVLDLTDAIHHLEALRFRLLNEVDERGAVPSGYTGVAAWLAANTVLSNREAIRVDRVGRALAAHPEAASAYESGSVCADHATLIVSFLERPPVAMPEDAIPAVMKFLLDAAADRGTRHLRAAIVKLKTVFESDAPPPSEDVASNELFTSTTLNGRVVVKGDVDAETGEMLLTALSPLSKPRPAADGQPDPRTPAQRRADGLTELLRRYHDAACGPDEGGERPHLHVHVDATDLTLRSERGTTYAEMFTDTGIGRMPWLGPLTIDAVRRIACDAVVSPIVVDDDGIPIDLGRTTRVLSRKLRRALVTRDHGCAFPDCGRPSSWCDGHHIIHWADGGPTNLDNLVLLCRFHHRLVHHGGWNVIIGDDRHPWFIPPEHHDPQRNPIPAHNRNTPMLV